MSKYLDQLHSELSEFSINLNQDQENLLLRHLEMVLETNKSLNLTRIDSIESGITLHLVDSLILLEFLCTSKKPFLDLGTGAGFPGIPLAIASKQNGVLCDSVKKKITAVDNFINSLGLKDQLSTTTERAETLGTTQRNAFSNVVARAVAGLPVLVEYATPLLEPHGRLVVTKGRLEESEKESGNKAAALCGLSLISDRHFDLPHDAGHREVLVYEKTGKARVKLPRRIGKAKSEPLA